MSGVMRKTALFSSLAVLLAFAPAPIRAEDGPPVVASGMAVMDQSQPQDPVAELLKTRLSAKFSRRDMATRERGALAAFYDERKYAPLWLADAAYNERAAKVIGELKNADAYGLKSADYQVPELPAGADAEAQAQAELNLSLAALTYIRHANEGRFDQSELSRFLDRKADPIDATAKIVELAGAADPAAWLASQHPDHPQFKALVAALAAERQGTAGSVGEAVAIPRGPVLKLGVKHAQVSLLRRRLGVPAKTEGEADDVYDQRLADAVKAFQTEIGDNPDGNVGAQTRVALNAPKPSREAKILANMERWRFMPRSLGSTYVNVNIPQFEVRVVAGGQIVHQERVIVGKPTNKTPSFSDSMEMVEFNPYWNVPESIIWNEMGGRIPAGWDGGMRDGRMWIRQPPGPKNALGKIKFLFPNRHSVYMHDTPERSLFSKQRRAFSHGCMRVHNPDRLAEVILGFEGWTADKVRRNYASSQFQTVQLTKHIPVHVTYFTLWADDAGKLQSFDDVYGHDNRIYAAIDQGVEYAKAKFPEVPEERVNALPYVVGEEDEYTNSWWFPSSSGSYWNSYSYREPSQPGQRVQVYKKKKSNPVNDFFSLF
jgi:murein L,D-transpeptidase YcbB/YkuD